MKQCFLEKRGYTASVLMKRIELHFPNLELTFWVSKRKDTFQFLVLLLHASSPDYQENFSETLAFF